MNFGASSEESSCHPLDPRRAAALDVARSREIPDKGLRNRWPGNLAESVFRIDPVVAGSAEIL
jgi:hypothetical protein